MMSKNFIQKAAVRVSLVIAALLAGYFLWQQLRFENQLDDLRNFCSGLSIQMSVDELQSSIAMAPTLRLILMSPDTDSNQGGRVFVAGAPRGSCDLTLSRGRLTGKPFSFGYTDPDNPGQKLKPWGRP